MDKTLEIVYNKDPLFNVEKVIFDGWEFPFPINHLDIHQDMYSGYVITVHFNDGEMTLFPTYLKTVDVSPPPPICEACGQEVK